MRRELKIVQGERQVCQILDYLRSNTSLKRHHPSQFVNSLYLDDLWANDALDNLSGLSDRKKIRLRWYADDDNIRQYSNLKLEVKSKKSFLSHKEVFDIDSSTLSKDISYDKLTKIAVKALADNGKIAPLLRPTLQVQYFRDYYIIGNGIRLTVDRNIRFLDAMMVDKPSEISSKYFDQVVMEIKFDPGLYRSVASIMNNLKTSPSRNSKYLRGLSLFGYVKYL